MIIRQPIIYFLSFLLAGQSLFAQQRPSIRASVTKNRILLGEPFQLVVESVIPGGSIVRPLRIDSIPHFEFLEPPVIDTIKEATGIQIKAVYRLTSFDSGHWVIPAYYLSGRIRTDTIPVDIVFTEDFDPNKPYNDIKDIIGVEDENEKKVWWYYAAGAALLLILLAVFLARRKKKPATTPAGDRDAYSEALAALEKLKKQKPDTVAYYSELVSIFRIYVLKRKSILSMQKTTSDLVVKIQPLYADKQVFDELAQVLRLSDLVKFAKYQPSAEDDVQAHRAIKNGIVELESRN